MQGTPFLPLRKGTWGESFWAGLPHLLFALFFVISRGVTTTGLAALSETILVLLLFAGLLVTIYYTWRDRWPAWSASWYGYVGLVILLFSILPYQDWAGIAKQIFVTLRFALVVLTIAVLLYWLSRRNPIEGLLMTMPVIILHWFPVMEFIPNSIRLWLTFWLFLLSALTAITITRLNDIRKAVWLMLGASVLSGLPIAYARTYWHNIPEGHFSPPTIGQMAELFALPWLASGALVLGPILGWGVWNLGRKHGSAGRLSALLMIFGMGINLIGHFSHWWVSGHQAYLNALGISAVYRPSETTALSLVSGGLAMVLVGAFALVARSWRQNKLLSIPLILVPLALPLVAMISTYFSYYIIPAGFSFEFARLRETDKHLIFFLGSLWVVMSGWMVPRLYHPLLDRETA